VLVDCASAAVGCPDFTVPRKAELKREGDRVTVTCQEDRTLSWQRKCVGTQWEGELGTCPGSYTTGAVNQPPGPLPIGKHAVINDFRRHRSAIPPIATDVTVAWSVVCMSITLVHPAKAVGRNEMPFHRDTCEVSSNIVLYSRGVPTKF